MWISRDFVSLFWRDGSRVRIRKVQRPGNDAFLGPCPLMFQITLFFPEFIESPEIHSFDSRPAVNKHKNRGERLGLRKVRDSPDERVPCLLKYIFF